MVVYIKSEVMSKIKKLAYLFGFVTLILQQKKLIVAMAKREVESQYVGSLLGFVWAFIQPAIMIFVFWFVFSIGFKTKPVNDVPFVVWLTAGMAPWFFFADIVTGSKDILIANTYLIKKTLFPSQILPIVKILSCFVAHIVFIVVLIGLIIFQQMPFSIYYFQGIYYLFCLCIMALGLSWFICALNVFFRDIGEFVGVIVQIGFWATPIFWDLKIMPQNIHTIIELNPLCYIIQGYRESFIYFIPFWQHLNQTIYFWSCALIFLLAGAVIFKKLKPHFADAL